MLASLLLETQSMSALCDDPGERTLASLDHFFWLVASRLLFPRKVHPAGPIPPLCLEFIPDHLAYERLWILGRLWLLSTQTCWPQEECQCCHAEFEFKPRHGLQGNLLASPRLLLISSPARSLA